MGDRANVYCVDEHRNPKHGVYFYTHWFGGLLPKIVQSALIRGKNRWGDGQYLNRIIFSEMIKDNVDDLEGFGISADIGDNEHKIIVVDGDQKMIGFSSKIINPTIEDCEINWRFSEYILLDKKELDEYYFRKL